MLALKQSAESGPFSVGVVPPLRSPLAAGLHEAINFGGQKVKGQGHTRTKIDLAA